MKHDNPYKRALWGGWVGRADRRRRVRYGAGPKTLLVIGGALAVPIVLELLPLAA